MNVCCFLVVENWTPIVLILDHILQVPPTVYPLYKLFPLQCIPCQFEKLLCYNLSNVGDVFKAV